MATLTVEQIAQIGFKSYGTNLKISTKACFYQPEKMILGNNIRIDDFVIMSNNIILHDNIHLAVFTFMLSSDNTCIEMHDFTGVSFKSSLMTISDTYDGTALTNPTIPSEYRRVVEGSIIIEKHAIIGAHCLLAPGVTVAEGSAIGAMSFVARSTKPWFIYFGTPAMPFKERCKDIILLEAQYTDAHLNKVGSNNS